MDHLEYHFDAKTFTVPLNAKRRCAHWLTSNTELKETRVSHMVALVQSEGDDAGSCDMTVDALKEAFGNHYFEEGYFQFESDVNLEEKLRTLFHEINRSLYSLEKNDGKSRRISLLVGLVCRGTFILGHSGGCRSLLVRNAAVKEITAAPRDALTLSTATLPFEKASEERERTRAMSLLGGEVPPAVTIHRINLRDGDGLLFFSDSLSNSVSTAEILKAMKDGTGRGGPLVSFITMGADRAGDQDSAALLMTVRKINARAEERAVDRLIENDAMPDTVILSPGALKSGESSAPSRKILVFLASMLITVAAGYMFTGHTLLRDREKPFIISLNARSPLKTVRWNNRMMEMERNDAEFTAVPGKESVLVIEPDMPSYSADFIVISDKEGALKSESSMERLDKNALVMRGNDIAVRMNIFSRIDPINPEYSVREKEGKRAYTMEFSLGNLRGPLQISSRHIRNIRGLFISVH